jgi:undecaprenyl diphosphate synthase
MQRLQTNVKEGQLKPDEINEQTFNAALDTRDSFPIDMLIRTSGEHRLSDFLLWQASLTNNITIEPLSLVLQLLYLL